MYHGFRRKNEQVLNKPHEKRRIQKLCGVTVAGATILLHFPNFCGSFSAERVVCRRGVATSIIMVGYSNSLRLVFGRNAIYNTAGIDQVRPLVIFSPARSHQPKSYLLAEQAPQLPRHPYPAPAKRVWRLRSFYNAEYP